MMTPGARRRKKEWRKRKVQRREAAMVALDPRSTPSEMEYERSAASIDFFRDGHDGPGWYYWSTEYPEEGSVGAFATREQAVAHLQSEEMFLET